MSNITELKDKEPLKPGLSVMDFWAPWCGPCIVIKPIIAELADDFAGKANIYTVNTDEEQSIAVEYGIRSIPTVLFIKDGKIIDQMVGANSKQDYVDKINEIL